jgi:dTDP-4-amino-4,6-dideoxygalactose transaminase
MQVPFVDLAAAHQGVRNDILAAWARLLDAGRFVGGEEVDAFEREFAAECGARHCVAVGSGTDALRCILLGMGIMPGDDVVTTPMTFIATAEAITQAGARPVFVDVHPVTRTMNPEHLEAAITPRTRCILPVHLYGQPADMRGILDVAERRGIPVVEDAAQAHLARFEGRMAGTIGHAGAFSFYPGKNLGACGEAGAVVTDDRELAATVRALRDHGQMKKHLHVVEGYNGRCDAMQAAALRVKLPGLAGANARRAEYAALYSALLAGVPGLQLPEVLPDRESAWHLYCVLVEQRGAVAEALRREGIGTAVHYPVPLHLMAPYAFLDHMRGDFPVAEHVADHALSLPLYPEIGEERVRHVATVLRRVMTKG